MLSIVLIYVSSESSLSSVGTGKAIQTQIAESRTFCVSFLAKPPFKDFSHVFKGNIMLFMLSCQLPALI